MPELTITAVRGSLLYFIDDPFLKPIDECMVYEPDGLLIAQDGIITSVGDYTHTRDHLPDGIAPIHYPNALIMPGFIDSHLHYPQTEIIGAYGEQLMEWLNKYAFVVEQQFGDAAHAETISEFFVAELLRNGTTTASVYCTSHPESVEALFTAAEKHNMRLSAGKMMMNRNAPEGLLDTVQSSYDDSKALLEKWHNHGRAVYCVSPRFAITSTPEQLEAAADLFHSRNDLLLQTHISENLKEIETVLELFPDHDTYTAIYDHFDLLGSRTLYGHAVHMSEAEFARFYETDTSITHCPTSNLFIGSGLFDLDSARNPARPLRVGVATDTGGGTSFSMLQTLNEAYKVAQLRGYSLTAARAYYLLTLGNANAMHMDDKIGTFRVGMEADFVVLDLHATPLLKLRTGVAEDIHEILFALMIIGDDRVVQSTYVNGVVVHERDGN